MSSSQKSLFYGYFNLLQVGALLQGHSQDYHECTGPRFNLKTVSAGIGIPYSDKIFLY